MQRRQKCTCDIKFFIKKMANHDFFYIFISRFHIPVLYVKLNVATSEYLAVKRDDKGIPAIYYSKTITVFYIVRAARRCSCVHALFLSHLRVVATSASHMKSTRSAGAFSLLKCTRNRHGGLHPGMAHQIFRLEVQKNKFYLTVRDCILCHRRLF